MAIHLFDQNFGHGMMSDDLYQPALLAHSDYYRPWRHLTHKRSGMSSVIHDKDKFQVNLDVQQFKPDEVTVKTVDNAVVVEGKHEEKEDEHGHISRHFVRRYMVPKDVDIDQLQCTLSSDGVLTFSMPKKALPDPATNERVVAITQTNAPAVKAGP